MGGAILLVRPLSLVGSILLARLLDPADFGQMAMAMILYGIAFWFIDLGMSTALVHSDQNANDVAFHAFLVTLVSGMLVSVLLYLNSTRITNLLVDVEPELLLSMLPMVMITALTLVPNGMLEKNLMFGRISVAKIISEIIYFAVALILAVLGYGVWSLVFGHLASSAVRMLLTWSFNKERLWLRWRPWNWTLLNGLLSYGLRHTGAGMITYFHSRWDDWFVGRRFGSQSLGYYSKAYDLSNSTLSGLSSTVVGSVFFPTYIRIRDDVDRMKRVYLRSLHVVLLIMTPIALGLLVLAAEFVEVLLGTKWLPMTETLQVFCLMAVMLPISRNAVPVFQALGRPQNNLYAGIVLSVVSVPLVIILSRYNIEGVAVAVVIAHTIGAAANVYMLQQLLPGTIRPTIKVTVLNLVLGGAMMLSVLLMKPIVAQLFGEEANILSLLVLVFVGAVTYIGLALITQRELILELVDMLKAILSREKRASASMANEVLG